MNYKFTPVLKCALVICLIFPTLSWGQGKCPKASGLSASTTETTATLSWSGGSEVVKYQVDVKHGPGTSPFSYATSTSDITATVEGLQPGSSYRFRVMTKCDKGSGGSSQWVDFTTAGDPGTEEESEEETSNGPCPKATNLAILEIDDTSATLGWLGNDENISYLVDVHQKEHTPTYKLSKTVDTTILFIDGLVAGGNYKFRVKSKCAKNSGGSSSWINFTTTGGDTTFQQCPKATNLSVPEVTDTSALLKWIAKDSVELFTLEVKSFGQTSSFSFDTTLVEDSLWVDGLEPDGDYHFRVLVTCTDGSTSGSSDWSKFRTLSEEEAIPDEEENTGDPAGSSEPDTSSVLVSSEIATFPNPATENFTVELPTAELGSLTTIILSDMTGRIVFQKQFNSLPDEDRLPIPVQNLQEGLYTLVIRSIDFHKTKTILVQHR
jgi:hypothetical protein